jgi:hypothetical protein
MGVKRWRKKAEERLIWAVILQAAPVKLQGAYAKEEVRESKY